jgi:hypothetical protein
MASNSLSSDGAESRSHLLQLHDAKNVRALTTNVVSFLADGLIAGGSAMVIATAQHREAFLREIARTGIDTDAASQSGRLALFDAEKTLARIMVGGHPDAERFDKVVGSAVREAKKGSGAHGVRAYGEMVGLLWKAKQFPAAIRLEQLWNKLRTTISFDLFCAYPIDVFDKDFDVGVMDALLCAHTHLLPSGADTALQDALARAIDEIHGLAAVGKERRISQDVRREWATLPAPEATILWLRARHPETADQILALARDYFQASA